MKYTLKLRLLQSVGATSLSPILTALIQLISVPVFLHYWGPKLYGEWLVISAIPVYLGFTDFGFGSVAGNEMTMFVARNDRKAALEVFQSTWLLTTGVSVFFGLCVALALWLLPIEYWFKITSLSRGQITAILYAFCIYVLLDLQWTVIAAGFRCDGNYALGTLLGNIVRFLTNGASIVAVAFHGSPVIVAITLVVVRLLGNQGCQIAMRRKSSWLHYGYSEASFSVIRKLFGPAIAYMAFPAGNAFIIQGMTIVVGAVLGPVAVVMYSTMRTLTRFVYQMVDMITNSVWAEMSSAFGAGDTSLVRALHRCACQASLGLSFLAIVFLTIFGSTIYGVWTHQQIAIDYRLFHLLLVEVFANALWFTSAIVPIACNRHARQALVFVMATAASLPAAYVLMSWLGLYGVGISLLAVDTVMIVYVVRTSLEIAHDTPADFAVALFRAPLLSTGKVEAAD